MNLAIKCEQNKRQNLEDRAGVLFNENRLFAVVCDGMGGMDYGDKAAQIALDEALIKGIQLSIKDWEGLSPKGDPIEEINRKVNNFNVENKCNSGTTICVLIYDVNGSIHYRWVGDSRIYLYCYESGKTKLLSEDNNVAWLQRFEYKNIDDETWRNTIQQNRLTHYIGQEDKVPRQYGFVDNLKKGDIVLICTDGAVGSLSTAQIGDIIDLYRNDDVNKLLTELFSDARKAECTDNQSAVCFRVSNMDISPDNDDARDYKYYMEGKEYKLKKNL